MNLHILNTFSTILKNDSKDINLECVSYGLYTWQPHSLICVKTQYSACINILEGCEAQRRCSLAGGIPLLVEEFS